MAPSLTSEPKDVMKFKGSMDKEIPTDLKITNTSDKQTMTYKLKCSDNDLFGINPVMGILKAGESATVVIKFTSKDKKAPAKGLHHISLYEFEAKDDQAKARNIWAQDDAKKKQRNYKIPVEFEATADGGGGEDKKEGDESGEKKEGGDDKKEGGEEGEKKEGDGENGDKKESE